MKLGRTHAFHLGRHDDDVGISSPVMVAHRTVLNTPESVRGLIETTSDTFMGRPIGSRSGTGYSWLGGWCLRR